ncbi:MAG: hypothetical protein IPK13_26395 [Deltaproteobacteria bacterium]|nr:hypothetical protein [Deltaproteobacteria bacterium]
MFKNIFRLTMSVGQTTQTEQNKSGPGGILGQLEGCGSDPAAVAPQLLQQLGGIAQQGLGMVAGLVMNCLGGCGG